MAIILSVDFTGTPDEHDKNGAKLIIDRENARRAVADPVEQALPYGTDAQLKAGYLGLLSATIQSAHNSYADQAKRESHQSAKTLWDTASDAQRAAALAALQS